MSANGIWSWVRERKLAVLLSLGCAAVSLALAIPLLKETKTPEVRMSAGPTSTRRHQLAEYFCEQAAANNVTVKLTANAGSEVCLEQLKSNQLDAAIVNNGVVVPDDDDIMVVGAVQLEAVHVLVRKQIAEAGPLNKSIRGKHVNLGERGSTEWLLARDFLGFARLRLCTDATPGDVYPTEYTKTELVQMSEEILQAQGTNKEKLINELPDVLIILASMPSPIVQLLVEAADYRLMPLPATRAFLLDNIQDSKAQTTLIHRQFLEPTTILSQSYVEGGGIPATDCETIGVRLLVVARKGLPESTVKQLTQTLFEGEFATRIQPVSPRDVATPYAIHPGAVAYLDRDKPLALNKVLEWVSKGFSFFGAFSAGALSFYSLMKRRKARKPTDYFAEIRNVENIAAITDADAGTAGQSQKLAKELNERLLKLRNELIEDICEGRMKSDQAISNIIMMLKDARSNIAARERETLTSETSTLGIYQPQKKAA
jgi:TRAP-type uncharacterized transport system substrate-binding protein